MRVCVCVCVEGGGGDDGGGRWLHLLWMAPPRLSDELKALSRQRRRDRRRELQRLRRADPEYRLVERARNTRARREQRNDPEYRKKERERDTRAHRERRIRVDTVMRNIVGTLWTNGNAYTLRIEDTRPPNRIMSADHHANSSLKYYNLDEMILL